LDDFSDLTIIIPTLNESGSIKKLLELLLKRYKGVSIIVSDDGSTDGTREAVNHAAISNKKIRFLDRKGKAVHGLTASVLDAAMQANTEKIVVMDADMQHPYEKVGDISNALNENDLVIGVRNRVKNWGVQRRIMSMSISALAYSAFVLRGKPTCADMMSGFFGIRSSLFKALISKNKKAFVGKGYKVLLDILKIIGNKASIAQVRYDTFHERKYGASKLSKFGINHASDTLRSILG
jgi:dolichol-phosphate mannosyltransferase